MSYSNGTQYLIGVWSARYVEQRVSPVV